ncbi:SMI1/KNR4 family protein [Ralstonia insidiosa]|uniref:KNR4-like cell wall assembly/cell proliferation coordinating protein n=1 Tax=Ralstonia insidiosa TaxID=190721 RepID=A0A848P5H4_9RALS|nr:SMI1/KNR4 family protein [Ralstonia insidiosa]NMV40545.1 KNR4-like cell wall assembly/cell proliferation coordinating protein [Ralstonia insidiosa]
MKEQWNRIEQSLSRLGCLEHVRLQPGASLEQLTELEQHLGVQLPEGLKAFLSIHDGQDGSVGLVGGELLLSVENIRREWDTWRSLDEDAMNADSADFMASQPEGFIKPMYTNRLWIPLTKDWGGNHIGLDCDPDTKGSIGQVIRFGRDEDTKRLVADNFDHFVSLMVSAVAVARWNGEYLESTV